MSTRAHYVYTCYDDQGAVLYVGQTQDLRQRRMAHQSFSHWFSRVERVRLAGPYPQDVALRREEEAIRALHPAYNTVHNVHRVHLRGRRYGTLINGFRVRVLRERAGITQTELAARVGCSGAQLSRIERGINRPKGPLLASIADALNVDIESLRTDADPPPTNVDRATAG